MSAVSDVVSAVASAGAVPLATGGGEDAAMFADVPSAARRLADSENITMHDPSSANPDFMTPPKSG
jgi:hypothetical protein